MSRHTRRPPVRRKTWGDFTWPHTALPNDTIVAPPSEREPLPDNLRQWWVHVCVVGGRLRGYTTDGYMGVESAACRHGVSATSGAEAKTLAIQEHKRNCLKRETL